MGRSTATDRSSAPDARSSPAAARRTRSLDELFPADDDAGSTAERFYRLRQFTKRELVYGYLCYPFGKRRQQTLADGAERSQEHLYTAFYRLPAQLQALIGPVLDHAGVDEEGCRTDPLRISVVAGSIGAEVYTIASVLAAAVPDLPVEIECSDLHESVLESARRATYEPTKVLRRGVPTSFVDATFERRDGSIVVREPIRSQVRFSTANIVDDDLASLHQRSDLVFAQNVFCHLDDETTSLAFDNIMGIAKPRAAVFIDGMSLDARVRLTARHDLDPLDVDVSTIHRQSRRHIPTRWWERYYGFEPYLPYRRDRLRRYSTIFTREGGK
ncbi:MAG: CheR family methyltransferase [Acidimicrobiales bacterium]